MRRPIRVHGFSEPWVRNFRMCARRTFGKVTHRWDVLNAVNHQNLDMPDTNFSLPPLPNGQTDLVHQAGCRIGRITNVQTDPRAMEFALKFYW